MPSVTGAPYPQCVETDNTMVKGITCRKCGHDLPEMTMADHLAGNFNKECPHQPTGDTELAAALALADKHIATNNRLYNELKMTHLENTVKIYEGIISTQRKALAKRHPADDEKPMVSCYAEVSEIVKTLSDGIKSIEPDYKAMCLRIALRSVRDLVDVLCEKTDNSGGAVIGDATRSLLDDTIEQIKRDAEPPESLAGPAVVSEWVRAQLAEAQRKHRAERERNS